LRRIVSLANGALQRFMKRYVDEGNFSEVPCYFRANDSISGRTSPAKTASKSRSLIANHNFLTNV